VERRANVDRNIIFHGELDRSNLQDLRAKRRELEHLFIRDPFDLARIRANPRISGIDAIDVGIDFARAGLERGRDRDSARVRAATSERRDIPLLVDALEAGDDSDLTL